MVDYLIHQIDEYCWIKGAWPVSAEGFGGRVPGSQDRGQNIDVYSIEYTFADGTKAFCGFRRIDQTRNDFATYIHGTKCAAHPHRTVEAKVVHSLDSCVFRFVCTCREFGGFDTMIPVIRAVHGDFHLRAGQGHVPMVAPLGWIDRRSPSGPA